MSASRTARLRAACATAGAVLLGPVALALVGVIKPQPTWTGAAVFAVHYHPIQTLPDIAGLLLVGGFTALVAALHNLAAPAHRARAQTGARFAAAFPAMVFLNDTVQTTFVPALIKEGTPDALALAGGLAMVNPPSLGRALELGT